MRAPACVRAPACGCVHVHARAVRAPKEIEGRGPEPERW